MLVLYKKVFVMDKRIKRLIVFLSIAVLGILFLILLSFVNTIRKERNCEFANIDNIEINTGIDIPEIITSDCNYDEDFNLKYAYFKLKELDKTDYILRNRFEKFQTISHLNIGKDSILLDKINTIEANLEHSHFVSNHRSDNNNVVVFNSKTNELWVVIHFKD